MSEGKIICRIAPTPWGQIAYGEAGQEVQFYWPVCDLAAELHQEIKNIAMEMSNPHLMLSIPMTQCHE